MAEEHSFQYRLATFRSTSSWFWWDLLWRGHYCGSQIKVLSPALWCCTALNERSCALTQSWLCITGGTNQSKMAGPLRAPLAVHGWLLNKQSSWLEGKETEKKKSPHFLHTNRCVVICYIRGVSSTAPAWKIRVSVVRGIFHSLSADLWTHIRNEIVHRELLAIAELQ